MKSNNELKLAPESVDGEPEQTSFYDPTNPILAPAKETKSKKRSWKRKLIGWFLLLVALAGAVLAIYYLLRISHVDVHVLADNRRKPAESKPQASPTANENALSAEAINIAREAIGADASSTKPTQTPSSALPTPTPMPDRYKGLGPISDFSGASTLNGDVEPTKPTPPNIPQNATTLQSHVNTTQSLFVEDPPARTSQLASKPISAASPQKQTQAKQVNDSLRQPAIALPPFGTMLPVRTQSAIFTLRNDSYARLEVTRDTSGTGWWVPRGTVFIGRTRGSDFDRAYVNIIGYIEPHENKLVKLNGDLLGADGAPGLEGKRIPIDKTGFKRTLNKVAAQGVQVAGMMAGALTGRGTVVINGARPLNPIIDEAGRAMNADEKRSFVKVDAGQTGYVMIAELPKEFTDIQTHENLNSMTALSDRDVMELILFGGPDDLGAALPVMTDEQKAWALKNSGPTKP